MVLRIELANSLLPSAIPSQKGDPRRLLRPPIDTAVSSTGSSTRIRLDSEYLFILSVTLKEIREDLLDSYKYVQHGLNRDLEAAGSKVVVDGSCSAAFGWSAGASNTIYLVSCYVTNAWLDVRLEINL